MTGDEPLVRVLPDGGHAELLVGRSLLDSAGIEFVALGDVGGAKRGQELWVHAADAERARELLRELAPRPRDRSVCESCGTPISHRGLHYSTLVLGIGLVAAVWFGVRLERLYSGLAFMAGAVVATLIKLTEGAPVCANCGRRLPSE